MAFKIIRDYNDKYQSGREILAVLDSASDLASLGTDFVPGSKAYVPGGHSYELNASRQWVTVQKPTATATLSKYTETVEEDETTSFTVHTNTGGGFMVVADGAYLSVDVSGTTVTLSSNNEGVYEIFVKFFDTDDYYAPADHKFVLVVSNPSSAEEE